MQIKTGSAGDEVKKLQARLGLNPDGSFGPITESRVKAWQIENNITPNGIIDDHCWEILFPVTASADADNHSAGFKLDRLRGYIPDPIIDRIPETASKFNITNVLRLSHFLAQCSLESGGFRLVFENLNYSAEGLKDKFKKYFPDGAYTQYARNPVKIGSRVYANRNGNGDEASGEGYKYRGRGYIQLTGKSNYARFSKFIGEDTVSDPDLVAFKYPLASAAFYFNSNNLWTVCDRGASVEVITAVTKGVNGGANGLPERIKNFNQFYSLLA